ncbi:MAG: hypothetical protein EOO40_07040, partial [Deltaproteobacteria bacterium]
MPQFYLIENPYHDYAIALIEHLQRKWQLQPICIYTRPAERRQFAPHHPLLQSPLCRQSHQVEASTLSHFATLVADHFDCVGVLPVVEESVINAARLAAALGVFGQRLEVIERFRNKYALKDYLRGRCDLRLNQSRLVRCAEDVLAQPIPQRFVLKPNSGTASRHIYFGEGRPQRGALEAYFRAAGAGTYVLE